MADQENPVEEQAHELPQGYVEQVPNSPTWPRDEFGMTSALRRELARAAGRINGDENKLAVFVETLRAGAVWAQSRMEVQRQIREDRHADVQRLIDVTQEARDKDAANDGPQETDDERKARQVAAGIMGGVQSTAA